jgi:hypothetical protein
MEEAPNEVASVQSGSPILSDVGQPGGWTGDRDHNLALVVMWVPAPAGWVVAAGSAAAGHDEPG